MNFNKVVRQTHRWLSIVFTLTVVANFVVLGMGGGEPPAWITYGPLPPLFLLLFTGLYLFVLPYVSRRRERAGARAEVVGDAVAPATEARRARRR